VIFALLLYRHIVQSARSFTTTMPTFQSKKYRSSASTNTIGARYRVALNKHPFLLFGLPFITTIVAGSFFLTPATALRYERHDRRVQQMTKDEELGIGKDRRKVDMNEEYYVSLCYCPLSGMPILE
jgi:cytochrome c oxidase assembly protein subunit 16